VQQAQRAGRCTLDNVNTPSAPELTESETADVDGFYHEILRILPLVGLRVFEPPIAVATPETPAPTSPPPRGADTSELDTVVVPAQKTGFDTVFLGQNCWHAIRISGGMLPKIKWIAAYQTHPISGITHYAAVQSIEPYGDGSKYRLIFNGPATELDHPVQFSGAPSGSMQGPRYTNLQRLLRARKMADLM
jgi:hypothetical protein